MIFSDPNFFKINTIRIFTKSCDELGNCDCKENFAKGTSAALDEWDQSCY